MKVRVRAKAGGNLYVTDENGQPIEGLIDAEIIAGKTSGPLVVRLTLQAPEVVIDAEASVEKPKKK